MKHPSTKIRISHFPNSITKAKWFAYVDFDFPVKNNHAEIGGSGASGKTINEAIEKLLNSSTVKKYFQLLEQQQSNS